MYVGGVVSLGCINLQIMGVSIPQIDFNPLPFAQGHKASVRKRIAADLIALLVNDPAGEGVPLPSVKLQKYFGKGAKAILDDLIFAGVVERVPYIANDGQAYWYRAASDFTSGQAMRYRLVDAIIDLPHSYITASERVREFVGKSRRKDEARTVAAGGVFAGLRADLDRVSLHVGKARVYLDTMPDDFDMWPDQWKGKAGRQGLDEVGKRRAVYSAKKHREWIVSEWEYFMSGGRPLFTLNENCGRLFTLVTNTPNDLRPFLRVDDGGELVGVDVKNSQPFLLSVLYGADRPLIEFAARGVFYDYFASLLSSDRDEVKESFFRVFYSHPDWKPKGGWYVDRKETVSAAARCKNELDALFSLLHPGFRAWSIEKRRKEGYNALALDMQRLEGEYIFSCVERFKAAGGTFATTVHDCIYTLPGEVDLLRGVMELEAHKRWQCSPVTAVK